MRRISAIVPLLAVLSMSGCSSGGTDPGNPVAAASTSRTTASQASPTATTTPTTTSPPALSTSEAAQRYLEIVEPYNVALEKLERAFNAGKPLDEMNVLAAQLVEANATQLERLNSTRWPAEVREPIAELIEESGKAQSFYQQAADASTRQELLSALQAAITHDGGNAVSKIRTLLHLDKYDEEDY